MLYITATGIYNQTNGTILQPFQVQNNTAVTYICACRAAAHSKMGNYTEATCDCERAIGIDPTYSKAYGRMGWDWLLCSTYSLKSCVFNGIRSKVWPGCVLSSLALTAMNKYPEAISYFKKALVLDPENDTYKSNLKIAEQKQKEATSPVSCVLILNPMPEENSCIPVSKSILCSACLYLCTPDSCRTGIRHGQFNQ